MKKILLPILFFAPFVKANELKEIKEEIDQDIARLENELDAIPCRASTLELESIGSTLQKILDEKIIDNPADKDVKFGADVYEKVEKDPKMIDEILSSLAKKAKDNELASMDKKELISQLKLVEFYFSAILPETAQGCEKMSKKDRKKFVKERRKAFEKYKDYIPPILTKLSEMYQLPKGEYGGGLIVCPIDEQYLDCLDKKTKEKSKEWEERTQNKIKTVKEEFEEIKKELG